MKTLNGFHPVREVYVEFGGDPSNDRENYKRYCGTEPFKPVGFDAEVVRFIEYTEYEKYKAAFIRSHDLLKHVCPDSEVVKEHTELLK